MNLSSAVVALVGCFAALAVASPGEAQNTRDVESRITQSRVQSSVDAELEQQLAKDWGLKNEEWTRYQQLMRGPLGIHSPGLDPLTALGIEARSEAERRRYAELQVRVEARRVDKLLAFQRAYDEAWQRLYPTLQPVVPPKLSEQRRADANSSSPTRLAVFVKDHCPPCDAKVKALQAAGRAFDVYMVGTRHDDARIRQWATRAAVDPAKVRSRTITLNHDAGRWLSVGGRGELPAVLREVGGQWRRE